MTCGSFWKVLVLQGVEAPWPVTEQDASFASCGCRCFLAAPGQPWDCAGTLIPFTREEAEGACLMPFDYGRQLWFFFLLVRCPFLLGCFSTDNNRSCTDDYSKNQSCLLSLSSHVPGSVLCVAFFFNNSVCFYTYWLSPHSQQEVLPFYRLGDQGTERIRNLPEVCW